MLYWEQIKKKVILGVPETQEVFKGDKKVILEVIENLLSKALRYAKERVEVRVYVSNSELKICVKDDGNGFEEDADKITEAFHQQNIKDSLKHAEHLLRRYFVGLRRQSDVFSLLSFYCYLPFTLKPLKKKR